MRLQIFDRMLLFNFVVSCGFYRLKLFFLLDRILIRKLISLLLFLKMAVEFSTLKGISIIPIRFGEHLRKRSREKCRLDNGEEKKDTQAPGQATTLNSWSHSGAGTNTGLLRAGRTNLQSWKGSDSSCSSWKMMTLGQQEPLV